MCCPHCDETSYIPRAPINSPDVQKFLLDCHGLGTFNVDLSHLDLPSILERGSQDLDHYTSEISYFQSKISSLERKRDTMIDFLGRCRVLISPMRRIPEDILGQIFEYFIHSSRGYEHFSGSRVSPQLYLSSVCFHWSRVVSSTPTLWADIDFELAELVARKYTPFSHPQQGLDSSKLCAVVEHRLRASKGAPLTIDLSVVNARRFGSPSQNLLDPCIVALIRQSHRWRTLSSSIDTLCSLLKYAHGPPTYPALSHMTLHRDVEGSYPFKLDAAAALPNLSSLTLFQGPRFDPDQTRLPWHQLTRIAIRTETESLLMIQRLLQLSPNLMVLDLDFRSRHLELECVFDLPFAVPDLRSVHSLKLSWRRRVSLFERLVHGLTLPALTSLEVSSIGDHKIWPGEAVRDFFSRSHCQLTRLSIERFIISHEDLLMCLRGLPSITGLTLKDLVDYSDTGVSPVPSSQRPAFALISRRLLQVEATSALPLLPKLRRLSLTMDPNYLDATAFMDMVRARSTLGRPQEEATGVANLHSIEVYLELPRSSNTASSIGLPDLSALKSDAILGNVTVVYDGALVFDIMNI